MLNLNINQSKKSKQTKQTDINSINDNWDSTKRTETPYFHCDPSSQNENERKVQTRKKTNKQTNKTYEHESVKGKYTNIFANVYTHTPTDIKTYINTDTHILINILCASQVRYCFQVRIVDYSIYALINPFTGRSPIYQSKLFFRYMMHFV